LFASLLGCKFCLALPFYIVGCSGRIYNVVHKLHLLSKAVIHFGVHNHLVADGKCKEFLEKTRRLNAKEVNCTLNVKMFAISLSAIKTFLARHLLDNCSNGKVELFKGEQLEQIQDKFYELSSPNIRNLIASFKHCLGGGYIDNILELKSKVDMITSKIVVSLDKFLDKRCSFQDVHTWCGEWNESCHMNATYKGFVECLDHVWLCEVWG